MSSIVLIRVPGPTLSIRPVLAGCDRVQFARDSPDRVLATQKVPGQAALWDLAALLAQGGKAVNFQQGQGAYYEHMTDLRPEGGETKRSECGKVGVPCLGDRRNSYMGWVLAPVERLRSTRADRSRCAPSPEGAVTGRPAPHRSGSKQGSPRCVTGNDAGMLWMSHNLSLKLFNQALRAGLR